MSHHRRYSEWVLGMEERLVRRRDAFTRMVVIAALGVGLVEALLPWQGTTGISAITEYIPWWLHIGAAAITLPLLYFVFQNDFQRKLQVFSHAMDDLGRRLVFLDPSLEPEQFELLEQYSRGILRPTQRSLDRMVKIDAAKSLRSRVNYFYRALPSPVMEEYRFGMLSLIHPKAAVSWLVALAACWVFLPGIGLWTLWGSHGLTMLVLLLPLYLVAAFFNARFAYEQALYDWLKLG